MISVTEQHYDPNVSQPWHTHDETTIALVVGGAVRERVGRIDETAGPLSLVVKPAETRHATTFGPSGAQLLRIRSTKTQRVSSPRERRREAAGGGSRRS